MTQGKTGQDRGSRLGTLRSHPVPRRTPQTYPNINSNRKTTTENNQPMTRSKDRQAGGTQAQAPPAPPKTAPTTRPAPPEPTGKRAGSGPGITGCEIACYTRPDIYLSTVPSALTYYWPSANLQGKAPLNHQTSPNGTQSQCGCRLNGRGLGLHGPS